MKCAICEKELITKQKRYCSRKCANVNMRGNMPWNKGLKGFGKDFGFQKGEKNPQVIKSKEYDSMTKEDLKPYFDKWVKSELSLAVFLRKEMHKGRWLEQKFKKCFKEELKEHREKLLSHNKKYVKGKAFEYRVKKHLEKQGYEVKRSAGSKFPDLIAIRQKGGLLEVNFIECKTGTKNLSRKEKQAFADMKENMSLAGYYLAWKDDKGKINFKIV